MSLQTPNQKSYIGGSVLKDSDEQEDDADEDGGSSNSGSGSSDENNDENEADEEDLDDETEIEDIDEAEDEDESEDRIETEFEDDEGRVEVRLTETQRIKVRTKNGERRIDVYQGGVKLRFEYKDGKFVVKAEYEGEEEGVEIEDEDIVKIVDDLEKSDIKISTGSDRIRLTRGGATASTTLPISIDLDTNSLVVTTPAGEKVVAVLPNQAVANLLTANTISGVVNDKIELSNLNGELIYEIFGVSNQRLLGIFPVSIEKEVEVSAESGDAVNISQSFLSRILEILSF